MNPIAVFDVASQRSPTPLDRTVGDSPDPAFANVMSQARGDAVENSAPSAPATENQAAATAEAAIANPSQPVGMDEPGSDTQPAIEASADSQIASTAASGEGLPQVAIVAGK